jgi:bacteriocin-like protein
MTTDKIDPNNAGQKVSKDELTDQELAKVTGGDGSTTTTTTTTKTVGLGMRKSAGNTTSGVF